MDRDLINATTVDQTIQPNAYSTTQQGSGIDFQNSSSHMFIADIGFYTGDGTYTFSVEESDDNSTWVTAPGDEIRGVIPVISSSTGTNEAHVFAYIGIDHRYIRVVCTVSGWTTGVLGYGVVAVKDAFRGIPY